MGAFARSSGAHHFHLPWHPAWHVIERSLLTLLGLLVCAIVATSVASYLPSSAATEQPAIEAVAQPTPELPREWRWERDPVSFDSMFRAGTKAPGLDHMYRQPR